MRTAQNRCHWSPPIHPVQPRTDESILSCAVTGVSAQPRPAPPFRAPAGPVKLEPAQSRPAPPASGSPDGYAGAAGDSDRPLPLTPARRRRRRRRRRRHDPRAIQARGGRRVPPPPQCTRAGRPFWSRFGSPRADRLGHEMTPIDNLDMSESIGGWVGKRQGTGRFPAHRPARPGRAPSTCRIFGRDQRARRPGPGRRAADQ